MERLDPNMHVLPPDSWPGGNEQPVEGGGGRPPPRRRQPRRRSPRGSGDRPGRGFPPVDPGPCAAAPDGSAPEAATHEGTTESPMAGLIPTEGHPLPPATVLPVAEARRLAALALPVAISRVAHPGRPIRGYDPVRALLALYTVATGERGGLEGETGAHQPTASEIALAVQITLAGGQGSGPSNLLEQG